MWVFYLGIVFGMKYATVSDNDLYRIIENNSAYHVDHSTLKVNNPYTENAFEIKYNMKDSSDTGIVYYFQD
jgi:hypothetical protein